MMTELGGGRQKGIKLNIIHRFGAMNIQKGEVVVQNVALLHRQKGVDSENKRPRIARR